MRFKNFSREIIRVPVQVWRPPSSRPRVEAEGEEHITISHVYDPGDVSEDYDPEDPVVRLLLQAHPELKPYVVPSVWEHLLRREL